MNSYDELTEMFQRHHVSQREPAALYPSQQAPVINEQTRPQQYIQPDLKPITYISQHYHHSTHIVPQSLVASTPGDTVSFILRSHGVDASTLSSAQLLLFNQGTTVQKMRLIELWRINPPIAGGHAALTSNWPGTSFEREEELARLRYETTLSDCARISKTCSHSVDSGDDMMSDSEVSNAPVTPVLSQDGRWDQMGHVEPYMMSGYEALAAREYEASMQSGSGYARSTNAVYKNIADIHHYPNVGTHAIEDVNQNAGWCGQGDDEMML